MVTGLLFVLAALLLVMYNRQEASCAEQAAAETAALLEQQIPGGIWDTEGEMPVIEIDGNRYIGVLIIPDLDLSLPVMEEWDDEKLKTAPCRYTGSYLTDDLVIAGHNYTGHFGPLLHIGIGSDVYFMNVKGQTFHYRVDNVETLGALQTEDMTAGDWNLTLFTCNLGGQSRCTVRCVKAE